MRTDDRRQTTDDRKKPWSMVYGLWSKRAGFTLIELLVVIGIIVLLAGIVMPNFMKYIDKAKKVRTRADIHSIENALAMYQTDWGTYPGDGNVNTGNADLSDDDPTSPNIRGTGELEDMLQTSGTNARGPYLSKDIPNDPYGEEYRYRAPGGVKDSYNNPLDNRGYDLWSYGKDKENDSGADDDITSWDTGTD